jgi:hypothetical protein
MRRVLIAALVLACVLPLAAKKKPKWALYKRPPETVEVAKLAVTPALQKCENWAWAAGTADMLRARGFPRKPAELVMKAYAGEVCDDRLGDLQRLAQVPAGDYVRDDGSKVRVEGSFVPGLPVPDEIIARLRANLPLVLVWRGHPYLVRGVVFQEAVAQSGEKQIFLLEIKLADPYAPADAVSFLTTRDDPAEIQGTMDVTVTPAPGNDWLRQPTDWLHDKPK